MKLFICAIDEYKLNPKDREKQSIRTQLISCMYSMSTEFVCLMKPIIGRMLQRDPVFDDSIVHRNLSFMPMSCTSQTTRTETRRA